MNMILVHIRKLTLLIVIFTYCSVHSQTWQYLGAQHSVNVSKDISIGYSGSNRTIYLGAKEGEVLKSTDGGQSWAKLGFSFADFVACEASNPTIVYAGSSSGMGLLQKSTDGGATFSSINNSLTSSVLSALAISPFDHNILVAGTIAPSTGTQTATSPTFRSTDGGSTWSSGSGILATTSVTRIVFDPANLEIAYSSSIDNQVTAGVYFSTDGGGSWTQKVSGMAGNATNILSLAITPQNTSVLYAGTDGIGQRIYKSTNQGTSWTTVFNLNTYTINDLKVDPFTSSTVYAATSRGVLKSTDAGGSWNLVNSGLVDTDVRTIAVDPSNQNILFVGTSYKSYSSTNAGSTWTEVSPVVPAAAVAIYNDDVYYLTGDNTKIMVSKLPSGSSTWQVQSFQNAYTNYYVVGNDLAIDPTSSNNLYVAGRFVPSSTSGLTYGAKIIYSTNGGSSWTLDYSNSYCTDPSPAQTVNAITIDPNNRTRLYACTQLCSAYPFLASSNSGSSWTGIAAAGAADLHVIQIDRRSPLLGDGSSSTVYVGGWDWAGVQGFGYPSPIFEKSTDGGTTWTYPQNPLPGQVNGSQIIDGIAIDPNNSSVIYVSSYPNGDVSGLGKLMKSTDGGTSWTDISLHAPSYNYFSLVHHPTLSNYLYAITQRSGTQWSVVQTTNGGMSWSTLSTGLPSNVPINRITFKINASGTCPLYLYAATNNGIYKIDVSISNTSKDVSVTSGYNLISVTPYLCDLTKTSVYPNAISPAWSFSPISSSYSEKSTLQNGVGYWVKFGSAATYTYTGQNLTALTVPVHAGWNMVGSLNTPIPTSAITTTPAGILLTPFIGFNGSYLVSNTIDPGKAYWVKVSSDGALLLDVNSTASTAMGTSSETPPSPPPPDAPALVSPANNNTNVSASPILTWGSVPGATSYHIQLSRYSDFSLLLVDEEGWPTTSLNLNDYNPLSGGTTYYWNVQSEDNFGNGAWSSTYSFTTTSAPSLSWSGVTVNGAVHPKLQWTIPSELTTPYKVYRYYCAYGEGDCNSPGTLLITTYSSNYTDLDVIVAGKNNCCASTAYYYAKATVISTNQLSSPSNKVGVNDANIVWAAGRGNVNEDQRDLPTEISLKENYPNPFNPTTNIYFTLPQDQYVKLIVYNVLGQEVGRLIDGVESAGYKTAVFDASNLQSGVYYYKFTAGSYTKIKKMLLIK